MSRVCDGRLYPSRCGGATRLQLRYKEFKYECAQSVNVAICLDTGLEPAWLRIAGSPGGLQDYDITVCVIWQVPTIHERAALWPSRVKVTHAIHPQIVIFVHWPPRRRGYKGLV